MSDSRQGTARQSGDVTVVLVLQIIAVAWLVALIQPVVELVRAKPTGLVLATALGDVAAFAVVYVWVVFRSAPYRAANRSTAGTTTVGRRFGREDLRRWAPVAFLAAIAVGDTVAFRGNWGDLFIFFGVAVAMRLPIRQSAWLLPTTGALAAALALGLGRSVSDAGSAFLMIVSIGIGSAGLLYAVATVRELRAAREEVARLAVAEERLRFARDLHDLLGRSLSLIALKSELAGQLATAAPERAASEMRDVEGVAREALREVREAVAGYRQPTLASELEAAGEILAAAGIRLHAQGDVGALPPPVEAALAWTVREGITNVIRHSRARTCAIRVTRDAVAVAVEVTDDGAGGGDVSPVGRSGLVGLTERVEAIGGKVEAGHRSPRGFRLHAEVPRPLTPGD